MENHSPATRAALALFYFVLVAPRVIATDTSGIDINGSISVTAAYSDRFNYLGNTRGQLTINQVEAVINGVHRFENGLRAGAQLYAGKVGEAENIVLDWGGLDYSVRREFGVRVGRAKLPLGLYNDSQDLDAIRTFATLPLSFYDKAYRVINSSVDGIVAYGTLGAGRFGEVEYQAYFGTKQDISRRTLLIQGSDNISFTEKWTYEKPIFGAAFFWNAPVEGLKVGWSYLEIQRGSLLGVLAPRAEIRADFQMLPAVVDTYFGSGAWDNSGLFAGTRADILGATSTNRVVSLEYTRGRWCFAAERKLNDLTGGVSRIPALQLLGVPADTIFAAHIDQWYGMLTCQLTERIGAGVYYSYENRARATPGSSRDPEQYTKDIAAAFCYAFNPNWVVKVEAHALDGRSKIRSAGDDNRASGTGSKWGYWVLKSTLSF